MIAKITGVLLGAALATAGMLAWQEHEPISHTAEPGPPARDPVISEQDTGLDEPVVAGAAALEDPSDAAPQAADLPAAPSSGPGLAQEVVGSPEDWGARSGESLAPSPAGDEPDIAGLAGEVSASSPGTEVPTAWQDVWRPFYSEESARGFARGLERVSGVELHVRKLAAGRYQVAFAHDGEAERELMLQRLSQASGLDLLGGGS